jgi:hypothetical protein
LEQFEGAPDWVTGLEYSVSGAVVYLLVVAEV